MSVNEIDVNAENEKNRKPKRRVVTQIYEEAGLFYAEFDDGTYSHITSGSAGLMEINNQPLKNRI